MHNTCVNSCLISVNEEESLALVISRIQNVDRVRMGPFFRIKLSNGHQNMIKVTMNYLIFTPFKILKVKKKIYSYLIIKLDNRLKLRRFSLKMKV